MAKLKRTILIITACYDEPHRTMGSVPKISRQLSKHARVVVFSGGSSTRVEDRSPSLRVYFFKEYLFPDPVNNGVILRMKAKVDEVIRKENPDAVLNVKHMFYPNLLVPYLRRKGYRVVTATDTFPGYIWFTASRIGNIPLRAYARTFGNWVLKRSNKVVLFHEGLVPTAKQLMLNYTVIPNGVELELISAARPKKLAGNLNILYVGRLESVKGYETIFKAMQQITPRHPKVHLYHIGDIKGKDEFVRKYKSKQIHFEGRKDVKDVYSYMKGAHIVVLASKSEGLPNVVMEGMACGCVPVSTPVGAVPALLENGKLGKLFDYGDVDALVGRIEHLIHNERERKRLAAAGKRKILREYDWDALAKKYLKELLS